MQLPLDWKFPVEKFNQKWATPLDFQKFFVKNIQKIKNGLRPSPPCFARSLPPRGSLGTRLTIFASLCASTMRQGEATKRHTLLAEENFVSKILCRQEGKTRSGWQFCEFFRKKNEQGQGLKKRAEFKLTSLGALRHSTCRDCLKTAIRQGFPLP